MDKTHVLKYDGYTVGDRLLDGVLFDVEIIESGDTLILGEVSPSAEAESYLANIRWENFVPEIKDEVRWKIKHHLAWLVANGRALRADMEDYAEETGEPEIDVLHQI